MKTSFLSWAFLFLVLALVAGLFGFGGLSGVSLVIAKWMAFIFIILLIVSVLSHAFGRN